MLDGVMLLSSYEEKIFRYGINLPIAVIIIISMILYFFGFLLYKRSRWDEGAIFPIMLASIFAFISLMIFLAKTKTIGYETIYEVTLEENVNINDFLNRYQIIEHRDKILVIKEKDIPEIEDKNNVN